MTCKSNKTDTGRLAFSFGVVCAALVLALPSAGYANAIIGEPIDWDTNPADGLGNWTRVGSETSTSIAENTTDGDDNFLQITFDAGIDSAPGDYWYETVTAPSDDLFALTWDSENWIEFDFWADDTLPDTLQIRWHGTEGGYTWANTVTPSGGGGWSTLRTDSFANVDDWRMSPGVTDGDFLADLESIDWIGVYIFRDGTDEELYGMDDVKLMVPEPAEYLMLAMALVTAFFVMRRQKPLPAVVQLA